MHIQDADKIPTLSTHCWVGPAIYGLNDGKRKFLLLSTMGSDRVAWKRSLQMQPA